MPLKQFGTWLEDGGAGGAAGGVGGIANAAGTGNVAGLGVNKAGKPSNWGEPGVDNRKKKKKKTVVIKGLDEAVDLKKQTLGVVSHGNVRVRQGYSEDHGKVFGEWLPPCQRFRTHYTASDNTVNVKWDDRPSRADYFKVEDYYIRGGAVVQSSFGADSFGKTGLIDPEALDEASSQIGYLDAYDALYALKEAPQYADRESENYCRVTASLWDAGRNKERTRTFWAIAHPIGAGKKTRTFAVVDREGERKNEIVVVTVDEPGLVVVPAKMNLKYGMLEVVGEPIEEAWENPSNPASIARSFAHAEKWAAEYEKKQAAILDRQPLGTKVIVHRNEYVKQEIAGDVFWVNTNTGVLPKKRSPAYTSGQLAMEMGAGAVKRQFGEAVENPNWTSLARAHAKGATAQAADEREQETFAGAPVFKVDMDRILKTPNPKHPRHRYSRYVGTDEIGEKIRQHGRKTRGDIVIQDSQTAVMTYLRRKAVPQAR